MAFLDCPTCVDWAEQQLAILRPKYPAWDISVVRLGCGRGSIWCARPAGTEMATINVESPAEAGSRHSRARTVERRSIDPQPGSILLTPPPGREGPDDLGNVLAVATDQRHQAEDRGLPLQPPTAPRPMPLRPLPRNPKHRRCLREACSGGRLPRLLAVRCDPGARYCSS